MGKQLELTSRISECIDNDWVDLLSKLDQITQSLIDNPSAGSQIRTALLYWCDAVDCRCHALPPDEYHIMLNNPSMNVNALFGTEI